ncbi:MAG: SDR family oxidoreductase [Anaerolineae bacterium]|nr:SDR family oxidoreductase [Anaerolineae bacterium]
MRVLVLGATGMLGHKVFQTLREAYEVWGTVRSSPSGYAGHPVLEPSRLIGGVDARVFDSVVRALAETRADVAVNCVGIVKQVSQAKDPIVSLEVNALFPHRLADLCAACGARLLHVSTDCVFSGSAGMYSEEDRPDATDLYGRSKLLGELDRENCLTLRTSIIGRELAATTGLVEWFLSQTGKTVRGYSRAVFSGLPTLILSRLLVDVIARHPALQGVYHVASTPISKYDLLCLLRSRFSVAVEIEPFPEVVIDRSLNGQRFSAATGWVAPSWLEMIDAMANDPTPYASIRAGRRAAT